MNIQVSGATAQQSKFVDAFLQRHVEITGKFQILISVHNFRHSSLEGFELKAERQANIVKVEIGVSIDRAVRYALNAVLEWLRLDSGEPLLISDGPQFPIRGVVEGFYGKPWTHEQRLKGIEFFADFGMNTYFLAPKDDPLQRFNWRSPFGIEFLVQAKELIERGSTHGVDFVACVSPGLSVKYSDQSDVDAVVNRFRQLMHLGAVHFGLLWDDIAWELQHPEDIARYGTTAQAHADFTNRVWDALSKDNNTVQLTVCPMQYCGRGNEPYLVDLGRELKSRINLMWTGRQICSEYLDVADAVIFERNALRPALYWDNFPVNDGGLQKSLFIGPVRGREKGLHKYSAGLLSNPMLQFEASLLPLATIGDYLWNSESYDPESSWERNLLKLYPSDPARAALRAIFRTSMGSCVGGDPAPDLRQIFRVGVTAWRAGDMATAAAAFRAESESISNHYRVLTSPDFYYPEIAREISEWLEKYLLGGKVLQGLADFLLTCSFDAEHKSIVGPANSEETIQGLIQLLKGSQKELFGDQIEGPLNELAAELKTHK